MDRSIIAIFACSVLTVSATLPALAGEAAGTIAGIDRDEGRLTLDDGSRYSLPPSFDGAALKPGMQIHLIYESSGE